MKAVLTFQGFTESMSGPTGTEDLFFHVIRKFASFKVTTLHPQPWKADIGDIYGLLHRQNIHTVILVGYSWGAGYACMKFARLAREHGISIPLAILCDPVYRPLWMPAFLGANPFAVRSLCADTRIVVPQSIKRVVWVRQKITIPRGHELVAKSPATRIEAGRVLAYGHTGIDESPEWFSTVRNELELELNPGP